MDESSTLAALLVNANLVALADHHADRLALGWRQRNAALRDESLVMSDLAATDDRLQASADALHWLGAHARERLLGSAGNHERRAEALFVFLLWCLSNNDTAWRMLQLNKDDPTASAVTDAVAWAPPSIALQAFVTSQPQPWRARIYAARADDDGQPQGAAAAAIMQSEDPASLHAGLDWLRCRGEPLPRTTLTSLVSHHDVQVRLAAARVAVVQTRPQEPLFRLAIEQLQTIATKGPESQREEALRTLACHAPASLTPVRAQLEGTDSGRRLSILALGWAGLPSAIPELIECLDSPEVARVAASSLAVITGSLPQRDGWAAEKSVSEPLPADQLPPPDIDAHRIWPLRNEFERWWSTHRHNLPEAPRLFGGRTLDRKGIDAVLTAGPLPWRALAAEHRQALTGGPRFPCRRPAHLQRRLMQKHGIDPT